MLCDLHMHSRFSFDGHASIFELLSSAFACGMDIIAVTDHFDMIDQRTGYRSYLNTEAERMGEFRAARTVCPKGRELLYGIELGDPQLMPILSHGFISARRFDFVIGALHFLHDGVDFIEMDYSSPQTIDDMFVAYFKEMLNMVRFGGFDTLAHLDYPLRAMKGCIASPTVEKYSALIEPVLKALADSGAALEINTRGTYDWQGRVGPEGWVLERFHQLGGRYVTVGSDAHNARNAGCGIIEAYRAAKAAGFDSITVFKDRQAIEYPITL